MYGYEIRKYTGAYVANMAKVDIAILVLPTNEELQIAIDTYNLVVRETEAE